STIVLLSFICSSTSSTSPLSTDAPAPHPSPASQASQANFELDHEAIASRATHMVEILSDENGALRQELETYYQKVAKLQKFEQEIHKVQMEHEKLIESTHKREHLEKLVRAKLEVEVKKLQERNRDLTVHVESHVKGSKTTNNGDSNEADLLEELTRKENTLFQTHMRCKDLEETNMQLMNELKEQRLHVDMLDAALSKAQADVTKLQEECAQRQVYVDKVRSLQQLVTSLQTAHQKREKLENKLRHKMEKEIDKLRGRQSVANQDEGVSELEDVTSESLAEREGTILKLEAEVSKWEHKYLEECAIRQCHVEMPSNSRLSGVHDMERDDEGTSRHKAMIYDLERKVSALSTEVQKREIIIQALQNQIFATMSSPSSVYPENIHPPSPRQSYRRGSADSSNFQSNLSGSPAVSTSSLHNLASRSPASSVQSLQQQQQQSPASSTHSLQHYLTKSPASSQQNLHMSPASSNQNLVSKSPASSQQNLPQMTSLGGRSPVGSQQNLGALARPPSHAGSAGSGLGSQERLMGFSDSYASLSTSGLSMTGTDGGSEADLAKEKSFLDEKLKQLDLEIAQQDKILGSIWKT
ncbi:angiomotin-like protein 1, partial [Lytechinus pictus]|uniref:angiomotin-like protein 1 n=1 Tax=Lytechinus pictus TaxID=7653 RepID=UPI0030B9BFB4